jgi:hypothetical protein
MITIKVTSASGTSRKFQARKFSSGLRRIADEVAGTDAVKVEVVPEKKRGA